MRTYGILARVQMRLIDTYFYSLAAGPLEAGEVPLLGAGRDLEAPRAFAVPCPETSP